MPELEGGPWFGLLAPAKTPRPIIDWLNAETRKAMAAPGCASQLTALGINAAARLAGGFRQAHRRRDPALGRHHQARGDQAELENCSSGGARALAGMRSHLACMATAAIWPYCAEWLEREDRR